MKIGIDCGANVGGITENILKECDEVYAFEPNPHAFKALQDKFKNNLNVTCFNKAVLDRNDTVKLYFHENSDQNEVHWSTGSSLLEFKGNVSKDKFSEVEAVDLCEFIDSLNSKIEILKIDVEGVEYEIINKLIDTGLIYNIAKVFVELHAKKDSRTKRKRRKP